MENNSQGNGGNEKKNPEVIDIHLNPDSRRTSTDTCFAPIPPDRSLVAVDTADKALVPVSRGLVPVSRDLVPVSKELVPLIFILVWWHQNNLLPGRRRRPSAKAGAGCLVLGAFALATMVACAGYILDEAGVINIKWPQSSGPVVKWDVKRYLISYRGFPFGILNVFSRHKNNNGACNQIKKSNGRPKIAAGADERAPYRLDSKSRKFAGYQRRGFPINAKA